MTSKGEFFAFADDKEMSYLGYRIVVLNPDILALCQTHSDFFSPILTAKIEKQGWAFKVAGHLLSENIHSGIFLPRTNKLDN